MSDSLLPQIDVRINRHGRMRRRDFLRAFGAVTVAAGGLSWTDVLNASAPQLRKNGMACILLWMQGGPSQFETFSPKPDHANGGETKAIGTNIAGIQFADNLPQLAGLADELCVIRSMTSREGSHPRATYLLHTAYVPTASVKYPTLGSNVAHEIASAASELPSFVSIGRNRGNARSGFLGVDFDPLVVARANQVPENTTVSIPQERFDRRLSLLGKVNQQFGASAGSAAVADQTNMYRQASDMVLSPRMDVFDITREPDSVRAAYGDSDFGAGCLLARRLVESGVTFVEVGLGGWDTHKDNFGQCRKLCEQLDRGYSQLLRDLKSRGMLDRTLVVWMGEFGRTPKINPNAGRDHFPRAFNVVLGGGGIRGGQVIGKTSDGGDEVTERPIDVKDLFCTIFQALQIDPTRENMSNVGRPIKLVDGGTAVAEAMA